MNDVLRSTFDHMYRINLGWIRLLSDDNLDLPQSIREVLCKIINDRHIRASHLLNVDPESELTDDLPQYTWEQLETDNYQRFEDVFHFHETGVENNLNEANKTLDSALLLWALAENWKFIGQLEMLVVTHKLPSFNSHLLLI